MQNAVITCCIFQNDLYTLTFQKHEKRKCDTLSTENSFVLQVVFYHVFAVCICAVICKSSDFVMVFSCLRTGSFKKEAKTVRLY